MPNNDRSIECSESPLIEAKEKNGLVNNLFLEQDERENNCKLLAEEEKQKLIKIEESTNQLLTNLSTLDTKS